MLIPPLVTSNSLRLCDFAGTSSSPPRPPSYNSPAPSRISTQQNDHTLAPPSIPINTRPRPRRRPFCRIRPRPIHRRHDPDPSKPLRHHHRPPTIRSLYSLVRRRPQRPRRSRTWRRLRRRLRNGRPPMRPHVQIRRLRPRAHLRGPCCQPERKPTVAPQNLS
jgi:hypothetical protein